MKLSTAIRRFDAQLRADGKSPLTRQAYLRDLNAFAEWLGRGVDLRSVTPYRLTRYLNSKAFTHTANDRPKAPVSLNRSKSAIRTFFQFTVDAGYLIQNPARLVRFARTSPIPPRPMSSLDSKKLLSTIRKHKDPLARRDYVMVSLMMGTGIRLGSLVRLDISDVDLRAATLVAHAKGGAVQLVYLSPTLRKELRRHLKALEVGSQALFRTRASRRLQARQVQLRFKKWLRAAGMNQRCTVHTLRHSFAVRLYERTGDLRLVQRALGHRRVGTTEIYTLVADSRLRRAVQALKISR